MKDFFNGVPRSRYIAYLAMLTAFVVLFQLFGGYIKIGGTQLNFVLVPVVIGGIILGPAAGGFLSVVAAVIILITGAVGVDLFTGLLLQNSAFATVAVVLIKGVLSGVVPAIAYSALSKKNQTAATVTASALAPIINTAVFIIGMLCMSGVLESLDGTNGILGGKSVIYFVFIGCAGINFIIELVINLVFSPAIIAAARALGKRSI